VFRKHLPPISKYLARRVESSAIEDLASEVFAIAWQKRESIPSEMELPWLYKTARFVVSNHRKKASVANKFLASLAPISAAPSAENLALAEIGLEDAWQSLSGPEKEILSLSVFEGLEISEISEVLRVNKNTVNIRLSRAKKKLLGYMKENG
jgi:RNA polymerase sigma factor (sigma-70 family)